MLLCDGERKKEIVGCSLLLPSLYDVVAVVGLSASEVKALLAKEEGKGDPDSGRGHFSTVTRFWVVGVARRNFGCFSLSFLPTKKELDDDDGSTAEDD